MSGVGGGRMCDRGTMSLMARLMHQENGAVSGRGGGRGSGSGVRATGMVEQHPFSKSKAGDGLQGPRSKVIDRVNIYSPELGCKGQIPSLF